MGTGRAAGERRAIEAAQQAISSPLLEDVNITGATGILINITGGPDLTLFEVNEASTLIQEAAHEDANIIFGSVIDANLVDEVRITVIATGFDVAAVQAGAGSNRVQVQVPAAPSSRPRQATLPYLAGSAPSASHSHVEMKTQAAMREQPVRPDQTPVTQPVRAEHPGAHATPSSTRPQSVAQAAPRLQNVLSGAEETELDIPTFLRNPRASVE